ncbi:MAG: hypothetical protein VBE63_17170 [Lamprobacter sp.]|uniref:hypothetical protein n=1 Tax=Lamprobacter sp. TaxID=3100796 RepID=UPI002B26276F|nr:hypothetical protein [Lamprobacter sp.]MEA3641653.1 hypothetical protein [Lamprobacter sp.]
MTAKTPKKNDLDRQLSDLWGRRATLSEAEWKALYSIVYHALSPTCGSLLTPLGLSADEAIQDFFQDKVFALSDRATSVYHLGALTLFYKRYLLSRQRDNYLTRRKHLHTSSDEEHNTDEALSQANTTDADDGDPFTPSNASDSTDGDPLTKGLHGLVEVQLETLLSNSATNPQPSHTRDAVSQLLGVELVDITREAQDFLNGRGHWTALAKESKWIRLYLRCHQCPEKEDAMALSLLASKHRIPSYHDRAVKIGVTVPKQQDAVLDAFRASYRGRWLQHLGIPVDPEHLEEMSLALKILCLVALNSQEPC